jgi:MFS family permease
VYALLMAVMGVAPVFAPLVGGQALAVTSWRGIFVVLAAIGVPLFWARRRCSGWGSSARALCSPR